MNHLTKDQLIDGLLEGVRVLRFYADAKTYEQQEGLGVYRRPILNDHGELARHTAYQIRSGDVTTTDLSKLESGRWYKAGEVQKGLGCSKEEVYQMSRRGELETMKDPADGRRKLYSVPAEETETKADASAQVEVEEVDDQGASELMEALKETNAELERVRKERDNLADANAALVKKLQERNGAEEEFWQGWFSDLCDAAGLDFADSPKEAAEGIQQLATQVEDLKSERDSYRNAAETHKRQEEEVRKELSRVRELLKHNEKELDAKADKIEAVYSALKELGDYERLKQGSAAERVAELVAVYQELKIRWKRDESRFRSAMADLEADLEEAKRSAPDELLDAACDVVASSSAGDRMDVVSADALRKLSAALVEMLRPVRAGDQEDKAA